MNSSRLSLILAGVGWGFGVLIFVLFQVSVGGGGFEPRRNLLQVFPFMCGCVMPAVWIAGVIAGANDAITHAKERARAPKASIAGLLLCLLGLAMTMFFVLATLFVD